MDPEPISYLEKNWELLFDHAERSCQEVLKMVERKQGQIQSLRDGVS